MSDAVDIQVAYKVFQKKKQAIRKTIVLHDRFDSTIYLQTFIEYSKDEGNTAV